MFAFMVSFYGAAINLAYFAAIMYHAFTGVETRAQAAMSRRLFRIAHSCFLMGCGYAFAYWLLVRQ